MIIILKEIINTPALNEPYKPRNQITNSLFLSPYIS